MIIGQCGKVLGMCFLEGRGESLELEGSLSFVEMKLLLVIIKVKHKIMTSCIQYKIQYMYNIQYKSRPNRGRVRPNLIQYVG